MALLSQVRVKAKTSLVEEAFDLASEVMVDLTVQVSTALAPRVRKAQGRKRLTAYPKQGLLVPAKLAASPLLRGALQVQA